MESPSEDVYSSSSDAHVSIVGVAVYGTLYKWDEIRSVHIRKVALETGPSRIPPWAVKTLTASLLIVFIAGIWLFISLIERYFGANVSTALSSIVGFLVVLLSAIGALRRRGKPEAKRVEVPEPHPLYIVSITTSGGPVEIVSSTAHWYVKRIAKTIKKARRESRLTLTGAE
ncbi:MAG TPA: DUF6232 family protein [Chloroflexia bacterium]|nr:DUF6232 family protein [Chloroflexia bacterium]